jgi:hypothetical protein
MPSDVAVSGTGRALTLTALLAMASGVVVALGDVVPLPTALVIAAAFALLGSIVAFGVVTFREARSSGSTFTRALGRSLRTAGKTLVTLLP